MHLALLPPQLLLEHKQIKTKRTEEIATLFWKMESKQTSGESSFQNQDHLAAISFKL